MGCHKICQIDADCYDDVNRLCFKGLCQCKDGFKQIGKNKFCTKKLEKQSKMNVMLICLLVAISPLAIVVVAVSCKKILNCSLTNSQTDKISSNNFQLDKKKNQNHHQNISINSLPNYDIESGSTTSFEYENADSLKSHKIWQLILSIFSNVMKNYLTLNSNIFLIKKSLSFECLSTFK